MTSPAGNFKLAKLDASSVEVTLVCVAFFWTLITVTAILLRRLLFHVYDAQQPSSEAPAPFTVCSYRGSAGNKLCQLLSQVRLSQPMFLALLDVIATFEVCACSLECWPVRAATGQTGLLIAIALNGIRGCLFTCRDAYGNPCSPWYRFLQGRTTAPWVGITWGMQLIGASIALRLAEAWWSLHPTVYHMARYNLSLTLTEARQSDPTKQAGIQSDLQVSVFLGFLIEAAGTFVDFVLATVFACAIGQWNSRRRCPVMCSPTACTDVSVSAPCEALTEGATEAASLGPSFVQFWSSFTLRLCINLFLTAKCIGLTGLYVNPANAFIQSWGVGGVSPWAHLSVYWLGPLFGVWLSVKFERWFNGYTTKRFGSTRTTPVRPPCLTTSSSSFSRTNSNASANTVSHKSFGTPRWTHNPLIHGIVSTSIDSRWMTSRSPSVPK